MFEPRDLSTASQQSWVVNFKEREKEDEPRLKSCFDLNSDHSSVSQRNECVYTCTHI